MSSTIAPLYSVEREFPVALERLWKAWTDATELERWYSPIDLSVLPGSVVSDVAPGGWWTVAVDVSAHGWIAYFFGIYSVVEPMQRLVHSLHYTQDADEFAARDLTTPSHEIHLDFEARGEGSWVRFAQFGEMPAEQAAMAKAGMESYLDNLGRHLAG